MNAVAARVRPKHQVLILRCYPRYQKGVAEVKPNPSELSYLLYYASTRRSKVEKVGAFLEKKSSTDVTRARIGNVQVTLRIIQALIDKSPRDLPLYGPYVLRILLLILRSKNLPMVEESVAAFETFCEHHDAALLTAEEEITGFFEELVRGYASLAGDSPVQSRAPLSKTVALKWRMVGLRAIKCVTSSEAVGVSPVYIKAIMPIILEAIHAESDEWLTILRDKTEEGKDIVRRRRMSTATAQTTESVPEEPAVSTTTADADRQAEEEAGLLAYTSLEQIYSSNRPQIRWATSALLEFVVKKPVDQMAEGARPGTAQTADTYKSHRTGDGTLTLLGMAAKWAPVQDRFVIMVTACEALANSPIAEENMSKQLILANIIERLLGSSINMIGLSVMDVLLTLVQHILLLLQLGGRGTDVLPHHQPTEAIDIFHLQESSGEAEIPETSVTADTPAQDVSTPSATRQALLSRLRRCIGNLAFHVYYSDQVRDIISAILQRLKPPLNSGLANPAVAIERPDETAQAIADSINMNEDPETDQFFSFGTARVAALNAIRDVLIVANNKGVVSGAGAIGRSRVSANVWEGTQWLLRDEDKRVRRAYVEALLSWLKLEVGKQDLRVVEETTRPRKLSLNHDGERTGKETTRAGPNSSPPRKPGKMIKSSFLQLLHLAVYDNALEAPEDESNILLMHLLLSSLTQKLGVNAARTSLPMIMRLQEDINTSLEINTPKAKINIGSLVHGYFWSLLETFDFDTTLVGYRISNEISRRQKAGLWLEAVQIPPQPLDLIISRSSKSDELSPEIAVQESLKPFDDLDAMVAQIEIAYAADNVASPPSSPSLSPGRVFTMPLGTITGIQKPVDELPLDFKEAFMSTWSKEACITAAMKSNARTISPHGSRSGTTRSAKNGLLNTDGRTPRDASPGSTHPPSRSQGGIPSAFMQIQTIQAKRPNGTSSGPQTPASDGSNHTGTLKVDDLKRVLAGGALADALSSQGRSSGRNSSPLRNSQTATQDFAPGTNSVRRVTKKPSAISVGTNSMMDAEGFESASEGDVDQPLPAPQTPIDPSEIAQQYVAQLGRRPYEPAPLRNSAGSGGSRPADNQAPTTPTSPSRRSIGTRERSASETSTEDPEANVRALRGGLPSDMLRGGAAADDGVPPVPPLPEGLIRKNNAVAINGNNTFSAQASGVPSSTVLTYTTARDRESVADGFASENRPKSAGKADSVGEDNARSSMQESYQGSIGRRSIRTATSDKRHTVQSLLGSIEVGDIGGKGIGTPPY